MYNKILRNIFIIGLIFSLSNYAIAQEATPYSRFGLGYGIENNNIASQSMGGLGSSFRSAESVNYINPASYSAVQLISFDAGFTGETGKLKTQNFKAKKSAFQINYVSFTVPVNKYWVSNISLLPFSSKDYGIINDKTLDSNTNVRTEYEGSGNLYTANWGNGLKYKDFSVGFNLGYLFGKLNDNSFGYQLNNGTYDASSNTTWHNNSVKASSFMWNAGAQYNYQFKSKKDSTKQYQMVIGVSGNAPIKFTKKSNVEDAYYSFSTSTLSNINTTRNTNQSIEDYITDIILPIAKVDSNFLDTISNKIQNSNIKIPASLNVGITFSEGIHWKIGADFRYQPWSKYVGYENNTASKLSNSWRVAIGGEYLPNPKNFTKFFTRLKYRAGFSYAKTNISIGNNDINEYGINFGVGIPVKQKIFTEDGSQTLLNYAFNLGVEVGGRGTIDNNLVKENFVKVKFGVTLNDKWFVKRKFY